MWVSLVPPCFWHFFQYEQTLLLEGCHANLFCHPGTRKARGQHRTSKNTHSLLTPHRKWIACPTKRFLLVLGGLWPHKRGTGEPVELIHLSDIWHHLQQETKDYTLIHVKWFGRTSHKKIECPKRLIRRRTTKSPQKNNGFWTECFPPLINLFLILANFQLQTEKQIEFLNTFSWNKHREKQRGGDNLIVSP